MKLKIIVLTILIIAVNAKKISYEGYSLYKVTPETENDLILLKDLQKKGVGEFWEDSFYRNYEMRIMVPKENKILFNSMLEKSGMVAEETIKDIQRAIDDQLKPTQRSAQESHSFLSMNWNQYYTLEEIYNWLDEVQKNYPTIVKSVTMGTSFENRPIKGIIIDYGQTRNDTLIGMLQGTLHAREWITTATITWIIKEFLTSTNRDVRALAENFQWHLFPVVNPDGYVYTFTTNRMWRKNRSTQNFTSCLTTGVADDMSNGVDLNRNFDYSWMTLGSSDNPCTQVYAGPGASSEPETRAISNYILGLNREGRFIYFIDFHSYTQLICIPYSDVSGNDVLSAENYADMFEIAARGAEKIRDRFATRYRVGVASDILYPMSGTNFDWAKYAARIPISYLIELRDLGEYGFLLPPEQIIPNNKEIMDALVEMDKTTRLLGYYSGSQSIICSFSIILIGLIVALIN
ncbi:zinc carboxypeptidase-like [Vanessa atalanta]|uniref:zinc carboxypeptidase-like n=1 Tax=Vanessa atalanta TaxID=42275 RepID=UPI001FCDED06|nr:zinc carboxypeptidase-like [Vanessa atalanta]